MSDLRKTIRLDEEIELLLKGWILEYKNLTGSTISFSDIIRRALIEFLLSKKPKDLMKF